MDSVLDIFRGDAFSNVTLTTLVNETPPYVPGFLSDLNIAPAIGITTLSATFEDAIAAIRMISASPRGAPPSQSTHTKGNLKSLQALHFAREVTVNADELLGVRARGTMNPQTLQNLLLERTDGPVGVKMQLSLTREHMLLGLVQGKVYDADGVTPLWDYYDWTNTASPSPIVIDFSAMSGRPDSAVLEQFALTLKRQMVQALNGMPIGAGSIYVLCGDNFYDTLTSSPEITRTRKLMSFTKPNALAAISASDPYGQMPYAGITWVNYRGTGDGLVGIDTDSAIAFMTGVPGLFQTLYAPADTFDTVTAAGLPFYLLNDPNDKSNDKRAVFELQSNPLLANLRPASCIPLTKS